MAFCNKCVVLYKVETCKHTGEEGEEGSRRLRPATCCLHISAGGPVCVCASLFYLETILKQILNNVQLPSINISADKRWGFALSGLLEVGTCSDFWVVSMLIWVLEDRVGFTGWGLEDNPLWLQDLLEGSI